MNTLSQLTIGETVDEETEPHDGGKHGYHPRISESRVRVSGEGQRRTHRQKKALTSVEP